MTDTTPETARLTASVPAMSDARLEHLAGLAELPCTCGNFDCERYTSALTKNETDELLAEMKRLREAAATIRDHAESVRGTIAILDRRQGWRYEAFQLEDGVKRLCAAIADATPELLAEAGTARGGAS